MIHTFPGPLPTRLKSSNSYSSEDFSHKNTWTVVFFFLLQWQPCSSILLQQPKYVCAKSLQLCLTLLTPWTVAHQAPLSIGSSRQEYWSGLPCPPPGDLPDPGMEPTYLTYPTLAGGFFTTRTSLFCEQYSWNSGEGNGTPLQYSCLENPMDGGAW